MSYLLDITENHLKVLSLFARGYDREYYIREVCRYIPVSHGTAWNILQSLEERGVADSEIKGKIRVFRLKKTAVARNYMLLAESYRRLIFAERYPSADEIIQKILPEFQGPLALFGSYSSGEARDDSDLDLLAIGGFAGDTVRKISKTFGIEINVKEYGRDLFTPSTESDFLIREMYKNHVFLKCPEFFVGSVMR